MSHRIPTRTRQLLAAAIVVCAAMLDAHATSRNFVWKVSDKQTAIYLVGSIHMLTKDYYPLNPALDSAFKESDLLVEEADLGEMLGAEAQMSVLLRGRLPTDQTLEKVVSPETYAQVNKHIFRYPAKQPVPIVVSRMQDHAGVLGAGAVAWERILGLQAAPQGGHKPFMA